MDPLDGLEAALGRLLLARSRERLRSAALEGAPPGVDTQNYAIVSVLSRVGPTTPALLAAEIGLDRSGVTRYADRLEAAGLITRERSPLDGRSVVLALTRQGERGVEAMRRSLVDELGRRFHAWSDRDIKLLAAGLEALTDAPPVA